MSLRVLIVDDDAAARRGMAKALAKLPCDVSEVADGRAALEAIEKISPQLIFLDLNMPTLDGRGVLEALGDSVRSREIVVVTANDALQTAVECMRLGAADYITKPYEVEQLRAIARRTIKRLELENWVDDLQRRLDDEMALGSLVGVSRCMRQLFSQIRRAAKAPLDILVVGETGTGKELIAREIHRAGDRADGPFVAVNTSAIQATLAESELFGHVKGAFTGATADRDGVFARANGGTVFLDEIGDMSMDLQSKLLRVLQERTVEPVGSGRSKQVDVRVVSATHQDLEVAVAEGHFREDLYYRIKGITLTVPPLRDRHEDIILLADYFLDRMATQTKTDVPRLAAGAVERLMRHTWPGNVRELQQVITAAASMTQSEMIDGEALEITTPRAGAGTFDMDALYGMPLTEAKTELTTWFERQAIEAALTASDGNVSAAARRLGIHRQSLQQKMTALGIKK